MNHGTPKPAPRGVTAHVDRHVTALLAQLRRQFAQIIITRFRIRIEDSRSTCDCPEVNADVPVACRACPPHCSAITGGRIDVISQGERPSLRGWLLEIFRVNILKPAMETLEFPCLAEVELPRVENKVASGLDGPT